MDRYAVIGQPISHSKSPFIHAQYARQTAQDLSYDAIEVAPEALAETLKRLHAEGYRGLNVTLPHKIEVAKLCESVTERAQLAAAVAELAGGSNTSLLDNLRKATGLDDLDVVTDQQGKTAVQAGRYISDHVYLGVEAGTEGNTKGTVNLDITKHLKAKGGLGTKGDSDVGLFYEKDY